MQLVIGRIGRPHGLRGEVTVDVRTDEPGERFSVGSVLATEPTERGPLEVASSHWHSGRLLIRFAGCEDREAAEELRGIVLVVDSAGLPALPDPDEFHDHELIGLRVVTVAGDEVGAVTDVLHHGQDLLVIDGTGPRAGAEILVPFVAPLVPEVDLEAGRLVIDPPPGLLDPQDAS